MLAYAIEFLVLTTGEFLAVILIGWILGVLAETSIILIITASLRICAGGAHSQSALKCAFITVSIFPGLGFLAQMLSWLPPQITYISFIFTFLVLLLLVWKLAPVENIAAPIISPLRRSRLRIISISIVVLIAIFVVIMRLLMYFDPSWIMAVIFGMGWMAIILCPAGAKLFSIIDHPHFKGG
ncbi:MAG: accessory gene regulator ArgB-like protein [Chitinophagales bacterium]